MKNPPTLARFLSLLIALAATVYFILGVKDTRATMECANLLAL